MQVFESHSQDNGSKLDKDLMSSMIRRVAELEKNLANYRRELKDKLTVISEQKSKIEALEKVTFSDDKATALLSLQVTLC